MSYCGGDVYGIQVIGNMRGISGLVYNFYWQEQKLKEVM